MHCSLTDKKSPRFLGDFLLLGGCFRFQLAHADGLGLAALCEPVFALNGEEGVLAFAGKMMT